MRPSGETEILAIAREPEGTGHAGPAVQVPVAHSRNSLGPRTTSHRPSGVNCFRVAPGMPRRPVDLPVWASQSLTSVPGMVVEAAHRSSGLSERVVIRSPEAMVRAFSGRPFGQ